MSLGPPCPAVPGPLTHLSPALSLLCVQARVRQLPPQNTQHHRLGHAAPTFGHGVVPAAPGWTRNASTFATWTSSG